MELISIDIGSTFTKGARFELEGKKLTLTEQYQTPTTRNRISEGFFRVKEKLEINGPGNQKIFYSSSAAGGLAISVSGIVPEVTMKMARQAALSAGGKITGCYSYKLTDADTAKLLSDKPDIILLTGGTDGGDESHVIHNAEMISLTETDSVIIYAGNRNAAGRISEILKGKELYVSPNVLPEINKPEPENTRNLIRKIFLERIISGKGLSEIMEETSVSPFPTPYSMLQFAGTIAKSEKGPNSFIIADIGGATTDIYSFADNSSVMSNAVIKGLPEPKLKRTVEGDLGLRLNAPSVADILISGRGAPGADTDLEPSELTIYSQKLNDNPGYLTCTESEKKLERILAGTCFNESLQRHAGRLERVYTSAGQVPVQKGKNLAGAGVIIGTGGYLAAHPDYNPADQLKTVDADGQEILIPANPEYVPDSRYILPLLANIAPEFPEQAVSMAISLLNIPDKGISNGTREYMYYRTEFHFGAGGGLKNLAHRRGGGFI